MDISISIRVRLNAKGCWKVKTFGHARILSILEQKVDQTDEVLKPKSLLEF